MPADPTNTSRFFLEIDRIPLLLSADATDVRAFWEQLGLPVTEEADSTPPMQVRVPEGVAVIGHSLTLRVTADFLLGAVAHPAVDRSRGKNGLERLRDGTYRVMVSCPGGLRVELIAAADDVRLRAAITKPRRERILE